MPFFMVDDQFHVNRKTQSLIDMGSTGLAALGLWTLAGSQVQAQTGDGQVLPAAWRLLGDKRLFTRLAKVLVEVGLWEERVEGWEYHDWFDIGYATGAKVKARRSRMKELKNPDVIEAIKARDGSNCRYCNRKVNWNDKTGDAGASYDHVIPGLARGVTNLVIACRKCNRTKAQRTPEQAGMTLLPPPNGPDSVRGQRSTTGGSETGAPANTEKNASDSREGLGPGPTPGPSPDLVQHDNDSGPPRRTRLGAGTESGSQTGDGPGDREVTAALGPAGRPPDTPATEGHTGSAWHNWQGRPPPTDDAKCATHGLDLPCRKCTADHYEREA